ncbi:MAG: hypothetical protein IT247_01875 [Bacteroidia bacterium]|nr:hypothetical protein [Bacteroidia bacterium]
MKGKKLISMLVFVLSILIFELLSSKLSEYILGIKRFAQSPYKATLVGMAVIVFVLFPAYKWMDSAVQRFTKKFLTAGKNIAGTYISIFLMFFLCFSVLFLLYLKMWFSITATEGVKKIMLWLLNFF